MSTVWCEVVVARYEEDLRWVRRIPSGFGVRVYNKGPEVERWPVHGGLVAEGLRNVGREAQTYLHHLVTRYERLAEVTVFVQGKPFDHVPDLHGRLRNWAEGRDKVEDFRWLGFMIDREDEEGSLFLNWSKNPNRERLPLAAFWSRVWEEPMPEAFVFYPGGNFAVTAECVRRRSRGFYERALAVSEEVEHAAHCFERTWDKVFGVNGIPEAQRGREYPVYMKPIRRLGNGE
ncbi:MAG TPA: DUF3431 domain-containing protein [Kiritimatiellia bacterium]|nr:DUF3431 domain-containing protein [Kiritimatiellia bacterium]